MCSSWYAHGAMTVQKKVVIIIDYSGSMKNKNRMLLAQNAALTVLSTLTPDDYVGIVLLLTSNILSHNEYFPVSGNCYCIFKHSEISSKLFW